MLTAVDHQFQSLDCQQRWPIKPTAIPTVSYHTTCNIHIDTRPFHISDRSSTTTFKFLTPTPYLSQQYQATLAQHEHPTKHHFPPQADSD